VIVSAGSKAAEPEWTHPATGLRQSRFAAQFRHTAGKDTDYKALFNVAGPADTDKVNPNLTKLPAQ
jgi:hypothetical protein